MITLVALTFPDDSPSLDFGRTAGLRDALDLVLHALREIPAADSIPSPPFRRDLRPPSFPRDSRRFRFNDDPDEWSN